jgi:hypothetical protein
MDYTPQFRRVLKSLKPARAWRWDIDENHFGSDHSTAISVVELKDEWPSQSVSVWKWTVL